MKIESLVRGEYDYNTNIPWPVDAHDHSMSNGGGFIGTMACDPVGSTLFRAVAAHSGAFYTDLNGPNNGCAPAKRLPLLITTVGKVTADCCPLLQTGEACERRRAVHS
jgi:hypothetical protein